MATVTIRGEEYCSVHALEQEALQYPRLLKKIERERITGPKTSKDVN